LIVSVNVSFSVRQDVLRFVGDLLPCIFPSSFSPDVPEIPIYYRQLNDGCMATPLNRIFSALSPSPDASGFSIEMGSSSLAFDIVIIVIAVHAQVGDMD
jgi:hypothetical protein